MYAVLPTLMDLSSGGGPTPSISPALRPPIPSPPALIPMVKIENESFKSENPVDFAAYSNPSLQRESNHVETDETAGASRSKETSEPNSQTNWDSENNQNIASQTVLNTDEAHLYTPAVTSHIASPILPAMEPVQTLPQNVSIQQLSVFSQRMLAAMLSLQRLQQSNAAASLGTLLPPPPDLVAASAYMKASQNIAQAPGSASYRQPVVSQSSQSYGPQSSQNRYPSPSSQNTELPLDLSKPATEKNSARKPSSPVTSQGATKRRYDANSIASIRSNFPTLLANKASTSKKRRSPTLTNAASQTSPNPWATSQATFDTTNQLAASQMQLHNWLLAAMSVQKMQQIALGNSTVIREIQPNQDLPQVAAKKSKMVRMLSRRESPVLNGILSQDETCQAPDIRGAQSSVTTNGNREPPPYSTPTPRKSPTTQQVHSSGRTPESPSSFAATVSPNSDHSQPGKRYRRYAKPPYSYVSLITLAILSSRDKKLRLSQILKRISEMFPFFNGTYQGWRDSVRHNLSQNECFVKVLKNPYRPTAKGNFWTVNLNSIPHELLLRQNTLVSRYAQDSGYRYRKDLTEVFNLRTGELKVPVPRHLLKNAEYPSLSSLCDDPAAVMEAILLEETDEDDLRDFEDKISPNVRQFTLEDLFHHNEENDDDSLLQSGRNRSRIRQKTATLISHIPQMASKRPAFPERQYELPNSSSAQETNVTSSPYQLVLQNDSNNQESIYKSLANGNANPFAAHQTAVLARALSSQMPGHGFASLIPNRPTQPLNSVESAGSEATIPNIQQIRPDYNIQSDTIAKKSKRKGAQPTRHDSTGDNLPRSSYEDGLPEKYATSQEIYPVMYLRRPTADQNRSPVATNSQTENTSTFQLPHIVDSSMPTSQM